MRLFFQMIRANPRLALACLAGDLMIVGGGILIFLAFYPGCS